MEDRPMPQFPTPRGTARTREARTRSNPLARATLATFALAAAACGGERAKESAPAVTFDPDAPVAVVSTGLSTPESVLWDATRRVWYVTNINGAPTAKDDNGYIVRLGPNGSLMDTLPFISGADDDITLHAPKGMALQGDTLWVADIDALRAFDVTTGKAVTTIDLAPLRARFLNDVALSPEGALYITDSGIAFGADGSVSHPSPSRVFEVRNGRAREAVVLPRESAANGITWHPARNAWTIVGFNTKDIYSWVTGAREVTILGQGPGGGDGVAILADGALVMTSWADSTLSVIYDGAPVALRRGLNAPADVGYDPLRDLIAIPLFMDDRVEFWHPNPGKREAELKARNP
jgi:sugar lactone lactonase YvrE